MICHYRLAAAAYDGYYGRQRILARAGRVLLEPLSESAVCRGRIAKHRKMLGGNAMKIIRGPNGATFRKTISSESRPREKIKGKKKDEKTRYRKCTD